MCVRERERERERERRKEENACEKQTAREAGVTDSAEAAVKGSTNTAGGEERSKRRSLKDTLC